MTRQRFVQAVAVVSLLSGAAASAQQVLRVHRHPSELGTLRGHPDRVYCVAISGDGRYLASGGKGNAAILWDLARREQVHTLRGHAGDVHAVSFSPDGKTLATGADGKATGRDARDPAEVRLWDVASGKLKATIKTRAFGIASLAFSPDGRRLASGTDGGPSSPGSITLWDVGTVRQTGIIQGDSAALGHDDIRSIAYSPDGKAIAGGGAGLVVRLWDVKTLKELSSCKVPGEHVDCVAFSPDGKAIAAASAAKVTLWDVAKGEGRSVLDHHSSDHEVRSVAFSPDGETLATGSRLGPTTLWDVRTGKVTASLPGHKHLVASVAFSPNGRTLATGSFDSTIKLWDIPVMKGGK